MLKYGRWLQIQSVSEADDGEYTCTAQNIQGSVKHHYAVTVEGKTLTHSLHILTLPDVTVYTTTDNTLLLQLELSLLLAAAPYWTKHPEDHLYAPGETVRMDCQADGIPTPNITWSINGVPIAGTRPNTDQLSMSSKTHGTVSASFSYLLCVVLIALLLY